eukprot:g47744.t1
MGVVCSHESKRECVPTPERCESAPLPESSGAQTTLTNKQPHEERLVFPEVREWDNFQRYVDSLSRGARTGADAKSVICQRGDRSKGRIPGPTVDCDYDAHGPGRKERRTELKVSASLVEGVKAIPGPIVDQCRSLPDAKVVEDEPPDLLSEEESSDEDGMPD